jgi:hypothetical protein
MQNNGSHAHNDGNTMHRVAVGGGGQYHKKHPFYARTDDRILSTKGRTKNETLRHSPVYRVHEFAVRTTRDWLGIEVVDQPDLLSSRFN